MLGLLVPWHPCVSTSGQEAPYQGLNTWNFMVALILVSCSQIAPWESLQGCQYTEVVRRNQAIPPVEHSLECCVMQLQKTLTLVKESFSQIKQIKGQKSILVVIRLPLGFHP